MNKLNLTTGFEGNEFGQSNSVFETDCEPIRVRKMHKKCKQTVVFLLWLYSYIFLN